MLAEHKVPKHEEAAWRALNLNRALQRRVLARCDDVNADRSAFVAIVPPAIAEPHLEARRQRQKPPLPSDLREHAQTACARDVVPVARYRKELVKRCVADCELGREHAVHP